MAIYGFRIGDANDPQYRAKFLGSRPNTETDENGTPIYTDAQWINKCLKNYFIEECRNGQRVLFFQQNQPTNTINEGDIT